MIEWCAYCQRYQGEKAPFHDRKISHDICEKCAEQGLVWSEEQTLKIQRLTDLNRQFWKAGLAGDLNGINALMIEGFQNGVRPIDMLFGLVGPSLVRVGELWESKNLTVNDEHRFTATCEAFINQIASHIQHDGAVTRVPDRKVLLANVPGNEHFLGIRFASLGLASIGLSAELAPQVWTAEALVDYALAGDYLGIGISVSMASQQASLTKTLALLVRGNFAGKIWVGGAAVNEGIIHVDSRIAQTLTRPKFDENEYKAYFQF